MRASTVVISSLLAGILIGVVAPVAQAQTGPNPKDPPTGRPGAIPMYSPSLLPPQRNTASSTVTPAGGTTWIIPGGWGGSTIIVNQPGYYPYYPGGFVGSTTVINNGGYYYSNNNTAYAPGFDTGNNNSGLTLNRAGWVNSGSGNRRPPYRADGPDPRLGAGGYHRPEPPFREGAFSRRFWTANATAIP